MKDLLKLFNKAEFRPEQQKGWFFYEWDYQSSLTIDLSIGFYHKINVDDDIDLYFRGAKEGYMYILLLKVAGNKTITWHNGNNIYLRFASGTKYETNNNEDDDYIYLGMVTTRKDDNNLYLDFIAMANNLEEMEE